MAGWIIGEGGSPVLPGVGKQEIILLCVSGVERWEISLCAPGVGRWEIMLLLEQKEGRSRAERLWAPWPQGLGGIPLLC